MLGGLVVVKKVREWCQYLSMEWTQSLCSGQNFCNQTMGEIMTLIEENKKRKKEKKRKESRIKGLKNKCYISSMKTYGKLEPPQCRKQNK